MSRLLLAKNFAQEIKSAQKDEATSMIDYFCGYGHECVNNPGNAALRLQIAMNNVERYYSVVGVLEEMDKSVKVFESFVPKFFAGISEIQNSRANTNKPKPKLSPKARELVNDYLRDEITFYEFCRQRLHRQFQAIS